MTLDLNQLNCFVAVAEELHFGRAATRLYMTQPPLSRQIQLLEHALGVQLLERSKRTVKLTAAGRVFLPDARRILSMVDNATITARRASKGETGRITIGFTSVIGLELIPELIVAARKALPHIDIILKEMVSHDQIQELEANTIDLGFMRSLPAHETLQRERIAREHMLVALPSKHPLTAHSEIRIKDLDGLPFVTYTPTTGNYLHNLVTELFSTHNVQPDFIQHVDESHTILSLVRAGLGVSIVPASTSVLFSDKVEFRPISQADVSAETSMVWRTDASNPALEKFRVFASEFFSSLKLCD